MRDKILACRWNKKELEIGNITQGDGGIQLRHSGNIGDEMVWQRKDE